MRKKLQWRKIVGNFILITLIVSSAYAVVMIVLTEPGPVPELEHGKVRSDYVLMLIQCVAATLVMLVPSFLSARWKIVLPDSMYLLAVIFLYCAVFLGEVRSFYYRIPNWDTILHTFSGAMLGALGFSFVNLLNKHRKVELEMSPIFIAVFSFCFAVALGTLWELYEFSFDGLFGINMQKYALEDGTPLVGRPALVDTMKDLTVDILGALVTSIIGYFSLKKTPSWIFKFDLQQEEEQNKAEDSNKR